MLYSDLFEGCPSHWHLVPFHDAIDFQEGPGILAEDFHAAGVPLLRLKSIQSRFASLDGCNYLSEAKVATKWSHFRVHKGDLLVSTSATLGVVSEVGPETIGAIPYTGIIRMRPRRPDVSRAFIRHFLRSAHFVEQAERMAAGSVMRHFGPSHLRAMVFAIPSPSEQEAICHILDALDDKIELNRRTNESLEAICRAIFKSWFVDFDPVHAKAAGRQPPGLDPAAAALFPNSLEDSPLGPIPKSWHVTRLDSIAKITSGKRPHGRSDCPELNESVPLYGGGGQMGYVPMPLYRHPILVTGRVGTLGLVFRVTCPCWPSDNTLVVMPARGHFELSYFILKGIDMLNLNRGSTQPLLTQTDLKSATFVKPSEDVLCAFANTARCNFELIDANDDQSLTLAATRDALLPKLLSGELRVKDAQQLVEAHV